MGLSVGGSKGRVFHGPKKLRETLKHVEGDRETTNEKKQRAPSVFFASREVSVAAPTIRLRSRRQLLVPENSGDRPSFSFIIVRFQ